jgi:hypothetical protein
MKKITQPAVKKKAEKPESTQATTKAVRARVDNSLLS